jgi:hypothetical protein
MGPHAAKGIVTAGGANGNAQIVDRLIASC